MSESDNISKIFKERLERLMQQPGIDPNDAKELRAEIDNIDPNEGVRIEIDGRIIQLVKDEVMLIDDDITREIDKFVSSSRKGSLKPKADSTEEGEEEETQISKDIRGIIKDLKLPGRIKFAMFGDATCRMILIRDASKLVQDAVLNNAKLTATEIEAFAKNTNVSEYVLRAISKNKSWTKKYCVKLNLVTNPKTPQDVSMTWIRFLNKSDLRKVAKSKNLPQLIANMAKKKVAASDKK